MTTRLLALAAALFAFALIGAGCGGDDGGSGGSDEDQISALVEESVALEDPATVCEENFTERALEDNYEGDDREALLEDCSDDGSSEFSEIEVSNVVVSGDTATADVTVTEDDETSEIGVDLVNEGGWKIDAVR